MSKISLQLHATADELLAWSEDWRKTNGLYLVLERFSPRRCAVVEGEGLSDAVDRLEGKWDRLWLCKREPRMESENDPPFADAPECLAVVPGIRTSRALREAALGAITDDKDIAREWRAIISLAKKGLMRGAVVTNPKTGATSKKPNHYFSQDALRLSRMGVKMLAAVGWNEYALVEDDM